MESHAPHTVSNTAALTATGDGRPPAERSHSRACWVRPLLFTRHPSLPFMDLAF